MSETNQKTIADLQKVPEFLLKKRKLKTQQRIRQEKKTKAQTAKNVRGRRLPKPVNFKRLEWFVERANRREWERLRLIKEARKPKSLQASNIENLPASDTDCSVVLVVRTCRNYKLTKATKKIFHDFHLGKIYQANLHRMDQELLHKLTILRDHVVWGYVSKETMRELILKRGRAGTQKNPEALNDNLKIEEALGSKGIICLEDLIFEMSSCGEGDASSRDKFLACSHYMLPFQLSMPEGGKRAVMNFTINDLKPGFRKESAMKELMARMV